MAIRYITLDEEFLDRKKERIEKIKLKNKELDTLSKKPFPKGDLIWGIIDVLIILAIPTLEIVRGYTVQLGYYLVIIGIFFAYVKFKKIYKYYIAKKGFRYN